MQLKLDRYRKAPNDKKYPKSSPYRKMLTILRKKWAMCKDKPCFLNFVKLPLPTL